ncbi:uncharacterized protein DDB_G0292642-like isoform X2 [Thalassophryne amazonica]|uniref:uncharacterized protein DDB_G0292642-like isoform X2 n=1 Tax=Thalassophryne amazonica TaxID=390379 RepID=UPI001471354B|nr:uncharacterized protein DDB_G0292642-like isoform X2 [Thalassophryne amazonica]
MTRSPYFTGEEYTIIMWSYEEFKLTLRGKSNTSSANKARQACWQRITDQGRCSFVCGVPGCDVQWPYVEVRKMALLTDDETRYFEMKMALNSSQNFLGSKSCPGCKTSVMRQRTDNQCVRCTVCTADRGTTYQFCWQCLREWKGSAPRSDGCDNTNCKMHLLETLKTCSEITFKDVKGVTGCPSIRACPTCGSLVSHDTTRCKNITCANCKVEFCFVCLKLTVLCHKTSAYYKPCSSGVAPRQTAIPVWQKK